MSRPTKVDVGCLFVGEYVDELELPTGLVTHRGLPVRPVSVEEFTEDWLIGHTTKEFTVLLHGGRVVQVKGHAIKHLPSSGSGDQDSFGVILRDDDREEFVAIFPAREIDGIFHGRLRVDGTVA